MSNIEFWSSISQIIENNFAAEGTKQLEIYAQQFIAGRLLFTRYTDNEQSGCAAGGTIHVIASILAGAETPADKLLAPEGSFKREQQRAEAQAAVIEQWARTVGCWVDNVVVDCDIRINTPELRCGGTRSITNEVKKVEPK